MKWTKTIMLTVAGFVPVTVSGAALAQATAEENWGWSWMSGHMTFGGGVLMTVFWVLVIGLILLLVRGLAPAGGKPGRPLALELLQERFARGEIDAAEYEAKREALRH